MVSNTTLPAAVAVPGHHGVVIRGDRWGTEGPDVLLLHGGGQTRHSWKSTGEQLAARGFRVTSVDLRGHGESDWAADGDYSLQAMAADIAAVLETLTGPVVLVGASMGGLTGLIAAHNAGPDTVGSLVLVDIVPRFEQHGASRIRDFMSSGMSGFDSLDQAADAVAAYLPHRPRPRSPEGLKRNLRQGEDGRWYWHWDPEFMAPGRVRSTDPAVGLAQLQTAARELQVPILLVRGMLSDVVSPENVEEFRRLVPSVQVVELARAAHTAAADDNEAFASTVIDFVTSRTGAGA